MDFDPYQQWLQLPAGSRPPNHYELLGLPSDASWQAIEAAALQRMAAVRRYQMGVHADAALQLIAELSEAFACLGDPTRRRQYDKALRHASTVVSSEAAHETVSDAPGESWQDAPPVQQAVIANASTAHPTGQPPPAGEGGMACVENPASRDPLTYATVAVGVAGLLVVPALIVWALSTGRPSTTTENEPLVAAAPAASPTDQQAGDDEKPIVAAPKASSAEEYQRPVDGSQTAPEEPRKPPEAEPEPSEPQKPEPPPAAQPTAPTPAASTMPQPKRPNRPPTVAVVSVSPQQPLEGDDVEIILQGQDPDFATTLRYEFRAAGETAWSPARQGRVQLPSVAAGSLELEFRCLDEALAASEPIHQRLEIEANPWADWRLLHRLNPPSEVSDLSFGGSTLAVGCEDGSIDVWNAANGERVTTFTSQGPAQNQIPLGINQQYAVRRLILSRDGRAAAVQLAGGSIEGWQFAGKQWNRTKAITPVSSLAAKFGAVMSNSIFTFEYYTDQAMAMSPDGSQAAYGTHSSRIDYFRAHPRGLLFVRPLLHGGDVNLLAFNRDGRLLACGCSNREIRVWQPFEGKLLHTLPMPGVPTCLAFGIDADMLACGDSNGRIEVYQTRTLKKLLELDHGGAVHSLALRCSKNEAMLLSGGSDGTLRLWRLSDGRLMRSASAGRQPIAHLAISADGSLAAAASDDKAVILGASKRP